MIMIIMIVMIIIIIVTRALALRASTVALRRHALGGAARIMNGRQSTII